MMLKVIRQFQRGTRYSLAGLHSAFTHELAFRIEVVVLLVAIPVIYFIATSMMDVIILGLSLMLVLITELMNSAIELTLDRISTEQHELTKRAKDIASAAVFLSVVTCVLVWASIIFR